MRTETTARTLYFFNELSEDAKQKAIEKLWDINVDYEWWEFIYENAANIGLKITGFDIDRASYCNGELTDNVENVVHRIIEAHGENCDTYKLAKLWENTRCYKDENGEELPDGEYEELEKEFSYALKEEYLSILQNEYEYLTSEEAIIETIEANEYEFTEYGEMA